MKPPPDIKPVASAEPWHCIRCRRPLDRSTKACTSCHWPFDPNEPSSYLPRAPMPTKTLYATVIVVIAVIIGFMIYAVLWQQYVYLGLALFAAVPAVVGIFLGFFLEMRWFVFLTLGCVTVSSLVLMLIFTSIEGLFCGLLLGLIFLGPVIAGIIIGAVVCVIVRKRSIKNSNVTLILILVVCMPFCLGFVEDRIYTVMEPVTVLTTADIDATPEQVWEHIVFYEETTQSRTWLLKIGLPAPVAVRGERNAAGDLAKCVYNKGYIVKKMTRVDYGRVLAFDVVEQSIHFERDISLIDGSFRLEPIGPARTRVYLTTRYISHIRPTWLWGPSERAVIHALHTHVLEAIRLNIKGDPASAADTPTPPPKQER